MNVSKNNIAAPFFTDVDASSAISLKAQQITAPMVSGTPLTMDEMMSGGGVRIVVFALDRSPSMVPVADLFWTDFNQEFVPAIKEAREGDISALRIAGLSFSSDIMPIWRGSNGIYFHPLDSLPPLTKQEYDPENGQGTALHAAIVEATAMAVKHAAEIAATTGIQPEIDVVTLTDGRNNESPQDPDTVKQIVTGSNRGLVRHIFFYFETSLGQKDPEAYAVDKLGYDPENVQVFASKPGESSTDRRKRFRRMLRVMSRVSASRGTSAVVAAAAVNAATQPDDLV